MYVYVNVRELLPIELKDLQLNMYAEESVFMWERCNSPLLRVSTTTTFSPTPTEFGAGLYTWVHFQSRGYRKEDLLSTRKHGANTNFLPLFILEVGHYVIHFKASSIIHYSRGGQSTKCLNRTPRYNIISTKLVRLCASKGLPYRPAKSGWAGTMRGHSVTLRD